MTNEHEHHGDGPKKDQLDVTVTYAAAKKPYEDKHVARTEAVGAFKKVVMDKFKVQESKTANEQVFFWLYHGDTKLEDESRPLGDIAKGADKLELMLIQQIIYGG